MVHRITALFQAIDHEGGDFFVILDHQNPHGGKHRPDRGSYNVTKLNRYNRRGQRSETSFGFRHSDFGLKTKGPPPQSALGEMALVATEKFSRRGSRPRR